MWLEMLIASRGENLLRVKGILNLKGQDRPVAIHAVRHVLHPPVLSRLARRRSAHQPHRFHHQDLPRAVIEEGMRAFEAATRPAS